MAVPDRFEVMAPVPDDAWKAAVAADPLALGDHTRPWLESICATGSWRDASRLYRFEDGVDVVVPLVERGAGPMRVASSFPKGFGFGGPIGADISPARVRAMLTDLDAQRWLTLRIRPNPQHPGAAPAVVGDAVHEIVRTAHVLDLRVGTEALWAGVQKSRRRRVRKAERMGVELELGQGPAAITAFESLRDLSVERWAGRSREPLWLAKRRAGSGDPIGQVRAMAAHLGEDFRLWLARIRGRPVAANLVILGANAHATRAAMDRDAVGTSGASELLEWHSILDAVSHGCDFYNLGDSGTETSVGRYKEGFGAEPWRYSEWRLERVPLTRVDRTARSVVKRAVGFRD